MAYPRFVPEEQYHRDQSADLGSYADKVKPVITEDEAAEFDRAAGIQASRLYQGGQMVEEQIRRKRRDDFNAIADPFEQSLYNEAALFDRSAQEKEQSRSDFSAFADAIGSRLFGGAAAPITSPQGPLDINQGIEDVKARMPKVGDGGLIGRLANQATPEARAQYLGVDPEEYAQAQERQREFNRVADIAGRSFMAGVGDTQKGLGQALQFGAGTDVDPNNPFALEAGLGPQDIEGMRQRQRELGQQWVEQGQGLAEKYMPEEEQQRLHEEHGWKGPESLLDPTFYANTISRQAPFTLGLMGGSLAVGIATAPVAGALGLGAAGSTILQSVTAGAASRMIEGAVEAGQTFEEAKSRGMSDEQAQDAANKTFLLNVPLAAPDIAEFALSFAKIPAPIKGALGKAMASRWGKAGAAGARILGAGVMEGGEEVVQEVAQRVPLGDEVKWDKPMEESFAVGAIMGTGPAVAGRAKEALTGQEVVGEERSAYEGLKDQYSGPQGLLPGLTVDERGRGEWGEYSVKELGRPGDPNQYPGPSHPMPPPGTLPKETPITTPLPDPNYKYPPKKRNQSPELDLRGVFTAPGEAGRVAEGKSGYAFGASKEPLPVGNYGFSDPTGFVPRETQERLHKRAYVAPVTEVTGRAFDALRAELSKIAPEYGEVDFVGTELDMRELGINHKRGIDAPRDRVHVNPYSTMSQTKRFTARGRIQQRDEQQFFARTMVETLIHELTHAQVARHTDPDTEFARVYKENFARTRHLHTALTLEIRKALVGAGEGAFDELATDAAELEAFYGVDVPDGTGTGVPSGLDADLAGQAGTTGSPRDTGASQGRGLELATDIRSGGRGTAGMVAAGSQPGGSGARVGGLLSRLAPGLSVENVGEPEAPKVGDRYTRDGKTYTIRADNGTYYSLSEGDEEEPTVGTAKQGFAERYQPAAEKKSPTSAQPQGYPTTEGLTEDEYVRQVVERQKRLGVLNTMSQLESTQQHARATYQRESKQREHAKAMQTASGPNAPKTDDDGQQYFEKGQRVTFGDGRHGKITDVMVTRWQSAPLVGGKKSLSSRTYVYHVKTDAGEERVTNFDDLTPETGEAPAVVPDPVLDGRATAPGTFYADLQAKRRGVREATEAVDRTRSENGRLKAIANRNEARLSLDKAQQAWDAWAAKYPEEADKIAGTTRQQRQLQDMAHKGEPARPSPAPASTGGKVIERSGKGGVEVSFPSKPEQSVIDALKAAGFRWSMVGKVWYVNPRSEEHRQQSVAKARQIVGESSGEKAETPVSPSPERASAPAAESEIERYERLARENNEKASSLPAASRARSDYLMNADTYAFRAQQLRQQQANKAAKPEAAALNKVQNDKLADFRENVRRGDSARLRVYQQQNGVALVEVTNNQGRKTYFNLGLNGHMPFNEQGGKLLESGAFTVIEDLQTPEAARPKAPAERAEQQDRYYITDKKVDGVYSLIDRETGRVVQTSGMRDIVQLAAYDYNTGAKKPPSEGGEKSALALMRESERALNEGRLDDANRLFLEANSKARSMDRSDYEVQRLHARLGELRDRIEAENYKEELAKDEATKKAPNLTEKVEPSYFVTRLTSGRMQLHRTLGDVTVVVVDGDQARITRYLNEKGIDPNTVKGMPKPEGEQPGLFTAPTVEKKAEPEPGQQPAPEPEVSDDRKPIERLFNRLYAKLKNGTLPDDPRSLRAIAAEELGEAFDPSSGKSIDELYDALEGALHKYWSEQRNPNATISERMDLAARLEAMLPRRTRSAEISELQQFSTPLPIAEAAIEAAQAQPGETVLEPTAGTGALIAPLRGRGVVLIANELDPRRVEVLDALDIKARQGDALRLPLEGVKADVAIMNPPWGKYTTNKYGKPVGMDFTPGDVAERFVAQAMKSLPDGGRLVAVMPTTMVARSASGFREWLTKNHTVRGIIESPEGLYKQRGTNVSTILLIVDKGKQAGAPAAVVQVGANRPADLKAYGAAVKEAAGGRSYEESSGGVRPGGSPRPTGERTPAPTATRPSESGGARPAGRGQRAPLVPAQPSGDGRTAESVSPEPVVSTRPGSTPSPNRERLAKERAEQERQVGDSDLFTLYEIRSGQRISPHPRVVVETQALAGTPYPPLTYRPHESVLNAVKRQVLSDEQYDVVAAVGQAMENGHGILVADDVGVGKSREIAGVALDLLESGKAKRIFITTRSANNVNGMIEELGIVAGGKKIEVIRVTDYPETKKTGPGGKNGLPIMDNAIYILDSYNFSYYASALNQMGFDAWLADEAHIFKNVEARVGKAWRDLHVALMRRRARIAYFTATPAQVPEDLQYLYALREWTPDEQGFADFMLRVTGRAGEQDANTSADAAANFGTDADVRAQVGHDAEDGQRGGRSQWGRRSGGDVFSISMTLPEMEQVMREMKRKGKYIARDLWRGGVEFDIKQVPVRPMRAMAMNKAINLMRDVQEAWSKFSKLNARGKKAGAAFGPRGMLQNEVKRRLFDIRLDAILEDAKRALANGEQVVIFTNSVSAQAEDEGNLYGAIRTINTWHIEEQDDGSFTEPEEIPEAVEAMALLMERAKDLDPLRDPIATFEEAFGKSNVALIIGDVSAKKREVMMQEFQAGKRKVAVISNAGTIGINLHHVVAGTGRRRLLMSDFLWRADDFKQVMGRVDRSGQVSSPAIDFYHLGQAGERKFIATIANRLKALGALSKGQAGTAGATSLESFEVFGNLGRLALLHTWEALDWQHRGYFTGRAYRDPHSGTAAYRLGEDANVKNFLLELQLMPLEIANEIERQFVESYELMATGTGAEEHAKQAAERTRGEILRSTVLADDLTLHEVRTNAGNKQGILEGVIMLPPAGQPQRAGRLLRAAGAAVRRYINFYDLKARRYISGLVVPSGHLEEVAETMGRTLRRAERTLEGALEDLKAGDRIKLFGPEGTTYHLHMRRDGKVEIGGAKMAHKSMLQGTGAKYSPVGSYWFVEEDDVRAFIERFPMQEMATRQTEEQAPLLAPAETKPAEKPPAKEPSSPRPVAEPEPEPERKPVEKKGWYINVDDRPIYTTAADAQAGGMRGPYTKQEASELTGTDPSYMKPDGESVYTPDYPRERFERPEPEPASTYTAPKMAEPEDDELADTFVNREPERLVDEAEEAELSAEEAGIAPESEKPTYTAPKAKVDPTIGKAVEAVGVDPNRKYKMRFRVVELDSLVASHTDNLAVNPDFPPELQPRLRDRAASRMQIDKIARELAPEALLSDVGQLDRGPMIVGPDLVVESGNGRVMGLRLAHQDYPERFAAYQDALKRRLSEYGLSDTALDGMDAPVLVRERLSEVDRAEFAAEANQATVLGMSPLEQAMQDAKRISDEALAALEVGENQSIDAALKSAANRGLLQAFVDGLPSNERAELLDASGNLNARGLLRLKAALFAKTYPGEAGQRLAQAFFESLDPSIKIIEQGMFASLPAMAKAEGLIRADAREEGLSLADDLSKAVDMLARLREQSMRVADYIKQAAMFERELNPLQERLLVHLNEISRSPKKVREFIGAYADAVVAAPAKGQMSMFGDIGPTKEAILERIIREQREQDAANAPLFAGAEEGRAGAAPQEDTPAKPQGPQLERGPVEPAPEPASKKEETSFDVYDRGIDAAYAKDRKAAEGALRELSRAWDKAYRAGNIKDAEHEAALYLKLRRVVDKQLGDPPVELVRAGLDAFFDAAVQKGDADTAKRAYEFYDWYAQQNTEQTGLAAIPNEEMEDRLHEMSRQLSELRQKVEKPAPNVEKPAEKQAPEGPRTPSQIQREDKVGANEAIRRSEEEAKAPKSEPAPQAAAGGTQPPKPPKPPEAPPVQPEPEEAPKPKGAAPTVLTPEQQRVADFEQRALENKKTLGYAVYIDDKGNIYLERTSNSGNTSFYRIAKGGTVSTYKAKPGNDWQVVQDGSRTPPIKKSKKRKPPEGGPVDDLERLRKALTEKKPPIKDRIDAAYQGLIRALYDRNYPLKQLQKVTGIPVHMLAQLVPGSEGAGEAIVHRFVRPVLDSLGDDVNRLEEYMVAMRMLDLLAINPNAKLSGTVEDPQNALDELEAEIGATRFAKIEAAAKVLWEINDEFVLKHYLDNGLLTEEGYDAIRQRWPHYIPFFRQDYDFEKELVTTPPRAVANVAERVIKTLSEDGSHKNLAHPLANWQAQIVKAQTVIARNHAAVALRDSLEQFAQQEGQPDLIKEAKAEHSVDRDTLWLYEDGQRKHYVVPRVFAEVAKGTEAEPGNILAAMVRKMAAPLRAGAITYNPAFVVVNPVRDAISAWFREGLVPLSPAYIKGWVAAATKNNDWYEASQAGVLMSGLTEIAHTSDKLKRVHQLGGIQLNHPADVILLLPRLVARANEVSEQATRIAVYEKLRAQGLPEIEAAVRGRDVTVDFAKAGNVVKLINTAIPFFNAGIQGSANTVRTIKQNPKRALLYAAPLLTLSVLADLWNRGFDDDDDKEGSLNDLIPEYERVNNWVFIIGVGERPIDPKKPGAAREKFPVYIKVPKGPMGAFLTAPAEATMRLSRMAHDGTTVEIVLDAVAEMAKAMLPMEPAMSGITPPVISTGLSLQAGHDFFRGQDIVPLRERARIPEQQFGPETPSSAVLSAEGIRAVAKVLGQTWHLSPRTIEFAITDMVGGAGRTGMWLADLALGAVGYNPEAPGEAKGQKLAPQEDLSKNPIVGRFVGTKNTGKEGREWDAFNQAVMNSRDRFALFPEAKRLGINLGEAGVSIKGIDLSPAERAELQAKATDSILRMMGNLVTSKAYKGITDANKEKLLRRGMTLARQQAAMEFLKSLGPAVVQKRLREKVAVAP